MVLAKEVTHFTREEAAIIRQKLRKWYRANARDLPWRQTNDPYAILVSEFMLQQTTVSVVIPYYMRWMERFPNVFELARAEEQVVLRYWQGLGYYSRAKNLLRAARHLVVNSRGRFPTSPRELMGLPGVGPYTAGAVAAFAFDLPCVVLDTNIIRVLARLTNYTQPVDTATGRAYLEAAARSLLPTRDGGLHNSSLMELGALVCTVRNPQCLMCPLRSHCNAADPEAIPAKSARKPVGVVTKHAFFFVSSGSVLLQLSKGPHWRDMWTLPLTPQAPREREPLLEEHYTVTRFKSILCVYEATAQDVEYLSDARFFDLEELEHIPMPMPHRRVLNRLLSLESCGPFVPKKTTSVFC